MIVKARVICSQSQLSPKIIEIITVLLMFIVLFEYILDLRFDLDEPDVLVGQGGDVDTKKQLKVAHRVVE